MYIVKLKKRYIAIIFCILLGWCGVHQFYLRNYNRAILYGVFFWTLIPGLISLFDLLVLVVMQQRYFNYKFNIVKVRGTGSKEDLKKYIDALMISSSLLLFELLTQKF